MQIQAIATPGTPYKRKDGKTFLTLVLRTDPETFKQVQDYALENRCTASQAVRELVEIGFETLNAEMEGQ